MWPFEASTPRLSTGARRAHPCRGCPLCRRSGAEWTAVPPKQSGSKVWRGTKVSPNVHAHQRLSQAFRDNERVSVHDAAFAQHLWEASGLQHACQGLRVHGQQPVGLNPNIRVYKCVLRRKYSTSTIVACRYGVGQRFGKHVDDTVEVAPGQHTRYTLLVYLSGGAHDAPLQGGETVFYGMCTMVFSDR